MREACEQVGAPADLVQVIEKPSLPKTQQLMQQADLIVATGGAAMVKAAYSSGTPAYGVGVGNSVHVVDETADLDDAANTIVIAKKFDYASSCLADNAVIAHESIYDGLTERLQKLGAYLCNPDEKDKLQRLMWPTPENHIPSVDVIAKSPAHIAKLAGFTVQEDCSCLIVEENGTGCEHLFSGEKLSPVLALYKYGGDINNAISQVNAITEYQGQGPRAASIQPMTTM